VEIHCLPLPVLRGTHRPALVDGALDREGQVAEGHVTGPKSQRLTRARPLKGHRSSSGAKPPPVGTAIPPSVVKNTRIGRTRPVLPRRSSRSPPGGAALMQRGIRPGRVGLPALWRVLGTVEEPGAVRQILIHRAWRMLDPRWPLYRAVCTVHCAGQRTNSWILRAFLYVARAVRRRFPKWTVHWPRGVGPPKAGNGFHHFRRPCDPLWQSWHKPCG
jgi:hypothetical protein